MNDTSTVLRIDCAEGRHNGAHVAVNLDYQIRMLGAVAKLAGTSQGFLVVGEISAIMRFAPIETIRLYHHEGCLSSAGLSVPELTEELTAAANATKIHYPDQAVEGYLVRPYGGGWRIGEALVAY